MSIVREVGRDFGRRQRTTEFLKRRGGLLPSVERERGGLNYHTPYITYFTVNEPIRKVSLNLAFYGREPRKFNGAYAYYRTGFPYFPVPVLPRATSPRNLLLMFIGFGNNATGSPLGSTPTFYLDPVGPGAGPQVPVDTSWVTHTEAHAYASDFASWHIFGVYSRFVNPGERTTTPVGIRPTGNINVDMGIWLFELPKFGRPNLATTHSSDASGKVGENVFIDIGDPLPGFIMGGLMVGIADYAGPIAFIPASGIISVQENLITNFYYPPNPHIGTDDPMWIGQWSNHGDATRALSVSFDDPYRSYTPFQYSENVGATVSIPHLSRANIPKIPYPQNQVIITASGESGQIVPELYASGVRVYIDNQDISQYIFGHPSGVVDIEHNRWDNIDIGLWVRSPGQHTLVITCDEGSVDVDTRFETI